MNNHIMNVTITCELITLHTYVNNESISHMKDAPRSRKTLYNFQTAFTFFKQNLIDMYCYLRGLRE